MFAFCYTILHVFCALQARKLMIDMVLATDMAIHFDLIKRFSSQLEEQPDLASWEETTLLYQVRFSMYGSSAQ